MCKNDSFYYICTMVITWNMLTLNAPIATKVVCFSRLLKCLRSLYGKQCGPRSDCSYGSTLFAPILISSVMLGNHLQQTTSAVDIFSCTFFSWHFKGYIYLPVPSYIIKELIPKDMATFDNRQAAIFSPWLISS